MGIIATKKSRACGKKSVFVPQLKCQCVLVLSLVLITRDMYGEHYVPFPFFFSKLPFLLGLDFSLLDHPVSPLLTLLDLCDYRWQELSALSQGRVLVIV